MRFGLSGQFPLLSAIIFSCDFYLDFVLSGKSCLGLSMSIFDFLPSADL